ELEVIIERRVGHGDACLAFGVEVFGDRAAIENADGAPEEAHRVIVSAAAGAFASGWEDQGRRVAARVFSDVDVIRGGGVDFMEGTVSENHHCEGGGGEEKTGKGGNKHGRGHGQCLLGWRNEGKGASPGCVTEGGRSVRP